MIIPILSVAKADMEPKMIHKSARHCYTIYAPEAQGAVVRSIVEYRPCCLCSVMAPVSQEKEPPANPGRFMARTVLDIDTERGIVSLSDGKSVTDWSPSDGTGRGLEGFH